MKTIFALTICLGVIFSFNAFASNMQDKNEMTKPNDVKKETNVQPNNIDKNNVGITSNEDPDQTDPRLIEGNLEDNDFKN